MEFKKQHLIILSLAGVGLAYYLYNKFKGNKLQEVKGCSKCQKGKKNNNEPVMFVCSDGNNVYDPNECVNHGGIDLSLNSNYGLEQCPDGTIITKGNTSLCAEQSTGKEKNIPDINIKAKENGTASEIVGSWGEYKVID